MNKKNKIIAAFIIVIFIIIIIIDASYRLTNRNPINKEQLAINYLNSKYGDGEWRIIDNQDYYYKDNSFHLFGDDYTKDGIILKITSSYINNNYFYLYVNESNMITRDFFLPTYYSIKYNLDYEVEPKEGKIDYSKLDKRMEYISTYHYPYKDYKDSSEGWYFNKPYCDINTFLMHSYYFPISIQTAPKKAKVLDIIPDEQRIPEVNEIIKLVEDYFSSGRTRNQDNYEQELYDLVFEQKATEEEVYDFISNHITNVDELEVKYILRKNK